MRRLPPPIGRFHRTVPRVRSTAQNDSSAPSPTFRNTWSPQTIGVAPERSGICELPRDVLGGGPADRQVLLAADAVQQRPAPLRPVFGRHGRAQGYDCERHDHETIFHRLFRPERREQWRARRGIHRHNGRYQTRYEDTEQQQRSPARQRDSSAPLDHSRSGRKDGTDRTRQQTAPHQQHVLGHDHHQHMAAAESNRTEQRQLPSSLEHVAKEHGGQANRAEHEPQATERLKR